MIAELKLFRYQWAHEDSNEVVYEVLDVPDSEGYERIRISAVMQLSHNTIPMLRVVDSNYYQDRTLMLEHVHDGRDLKIFNPEMSAEDITSILEEHGDLSGEVEIAEAGQVLRHIGTIWKNPVVLQTTYDDSSLLVRCDRDGQLTAEVAT